jgi:hypothetical protein
VLLNSSPQMLNLEHCRSKGGIKGPRTLFGGRMIRAVPAQANRSQSTQNLPSDSSRGQVITPCCDLPEDSHCLEERRSQTDAAFKREGLRRPAKHAGAGRVWLGCSQWLAWPGQLARFLVCRTCQSELPITIWTESGRVAAGWC